MIGRLIELMNCCIGIPYVDNRRSHTGTLTKFAEIMENANKHE